MLRLFAYFTLAVLLYNGLYFLRIMEGTYRYHQGLINHYCEEITEEKEQEYRDTLP